ncbi:MAG: hypothetical protein ACYC8T_11405 [Myxococcaceae bacterium]
MGPQPRLRLALVVSLALFGSVALAATRTGLPAAIMRWIWNEPPPAAPPHPVKARTAAEAPPEVEIAVEPGSVVIRSGTLEVPGAQERSEASAEYENDPALEIDLAAELDEASETRGPSESPQTPEKPGPPGLPQASESPRSRHTAQASAAPEQRHPAQAFEPIAAPPPSAADSPGEAPAASSPLTASPAPAGREDRAVPAQPIFPCSGPLTPLAARPGSGEPMDPVDEYRLPVPTADECRAEISRLTAALAEPATDSEAEGDLISRATCHAVLGDRWSCYSDLDLYLSRFPNGRFVGRARFMLQD